MPKFKLDGYVRKRERFQRGKDVVEKEDGYEIVYTKYNGREMAIYVYENLKKKNKKFF